ncbi:MAG: ABC transporter permease [Pseudoclavibacter sp.]
MLKVLLSRAGQSLLALALSSIAIFALLRLIPGDPASVIAGAEASPEVIEQIREERGFNEPVVVQYFLWLGRVLQGDFGDSYTARQPVADLIMPTLMPSLLLLLGGVVIAIVVAFGIGVGASVTQNRSVDAVLMSVAAFLYGAPVFWIGLLLILVFSVTLGWLPAGGYVDPAVSLQESVRSLLLPWIVLGLAMGAGLSRFVRSAFLDVFESDYIRVARSKGASPWRILYVHATRNALVPVVTVFGIAFAGLLGGAVVIEQVFTWPGLGTLMLNSVNGRDYPTVQAIMLIYVFVFIAVNFLTDLSYSLIDPRIRVSGAR